jgi:hypothetical protein
MLDLELDTTMTLSGGWQGTIEPRRTADTTQRARVQIVIGRDATP